VPPDRCASCGCATARSNGSCFRDLEREGVWREVFLVESWMQYLRMLDRLTLADKIVLDQLRALHTGRQTAGGVAQRQLPGHERSPGFSLRREPESL